MAGFWCGASHWFIFVCLLTVSPPTKKERLSCVSSYEGTRKPIQGICLRSEFQHMNLGGHKHSVQGFPGGAVVKNLPANAEDTHSSPGPGRSHMPQSN